MTILGYHTAHELSDLLAAKVANVADYETSITNANTSDPAWAAWYADYKAFRAAWDPVAADATEAVSIDKATGLWDETPEESRYQAILTAVAPLDDLARRWTFGTFTNSGTPQPTAPDADLSTLNTINSLPVVGANAKSSTTLYLLAGGAAIGVVALALLKRAV